MSAVCTKISGMNNHSIKRMGPFFKNCQVCAYKNGPAADGARNFLYYQIDYQRSENCLGPNNSIFFGLEADVAVALSWTAGDFLPGSAIDV